MKRFFRILALTILGILILSIAFVVVTFPPIMSGMAAKTMCSCVFVAGRTAESVVAKRTSGISRTFKGQDQIH